MDKKIKVTVQYVGDIDFVTEVSASMDLQAIKVQAMKHFDLEVGKNDEYSLRYNEADLASHKKIGDLEQDEVILTLSFNKESTKG